jgi:hypothetical protein
MAMPFRSGWLGRDEALKAYELHRSSFAEFSIIGDPHNYRNGVKVCLWEAALQVLGKHIPSYRQEIGDCVSFGAANAVMYTSVVDIAKGAAFEFKYAYQPFIYGVSRVDVGGQRSRSDGSTGTWGAKACRDYGVLFYDDEGVPGYSGNVASDWGYSGPPKKFYPIAKDNPVKTVAKINSFDDVVQAIANGFACSIASDVGFEGDGNMQGKVSGGKCWGVRGGTWMHQMSIIAVDTIDSRPGAFIMNSWGPNTWREQPDGAPIGGFWADAKHIDNICRQDDSYAFSGFDGFPGREIDFSII